MKAIYYKIFGLGHINPTLPIVKQLTDAGVKIIYHTSPERKELIEKSGAIYRNYGYDSYSAADFNPGKNFVLQTIPATVGLLPFLQDEIEREKPDFILYDSMAPWGYVLGKLNNIPAYCTVTTFALSRNKRKDTMAKFNIQIDEQNTEALAYLRNRGIQMELEDALGTYSDHNIVFTTADFNPPLEDLNPAHFTFMGAMTDREEDLSLLPVLDKNKKIITMSLGSILPDEDPSVLNWYRELIKAFGNNDDYQIIMNAGDLGPLPSNCISLKRIPQLHILKHTDVFIHHAGMNSLNEGLHYNVPMLVIPHSKDQFTNAARLVETGRGLSLDKSRVTSANLKQKVLELL
jgi:MGT family glycosyltransferase